MWLWVDIITSGEAWEAATPRWVIFVWVEYKLVHSLYFLTVTTTDVYTTATACIHNSYYIIRYSYYMYTLQLLHVYITVTTCIHYNATLYTTVTTCIHYSYTLQLHTTATTCIHYNATCIYYHATCIYYNIICMRCHSLVQTSQLHSLHYVLYKYDYTWISPYIQYNLQGDA